MNETIDNHSAYSTTK